MNHRSSVKQLYKELLWIGREYPQGFSHFREGKRRELAHTRIAQGIHKEQGTDG